MLELIRIQIWHLQVRNSKPGKNVQLAENEIRGLCLKSRELFLSQPILLELEAPLKICGKFLDRTLEMALVIDGGVLTVGCFGVLQVTSTDNTMTCCVYLNMVAFHPNRTIFSLVITSTVANNHWRPYAFCWPTKSNFLKTSSYYAATTNVQA